jgi:hypothetical protein
MATSKCSRGIGNPLHEQITVDMAFSWYCDVYIRYTCVHTILPCVHTILPCVHTIHLCTYDTALCTYDTPKEVCVFVCAEVSGCQGESTETHAHCVSVSVCPCVCLCVCVCVCVIRYRGPLLPGNRMQAITTGLV